MGNEEHVKILKQGAQVWNEWRKENPDVRPDLAQENLSYVDLIGADLKYEPILDEDFNDENFSDEDRAFADLSDIAFTDSEISRSANLKNADLSYAILFGAKLNHVNLNGANLYHASLSRADLDFADLSGANLTEADLEGVSFLGTNLQDADFTEALIGSTIFAEIDLGVAIGLASVRHFAPSYISIDTLDKSAGNIPDAFLRGCGLSDWQIENAKLFNPDLSGEDVNNFFYKIHDLRAYQAIQISPLFISYSHNDGAFVDRIEKYLNEKGIRYWRDIHHATAGRLEKQIDRAIILNDIVLLVLSEHSTNSDWVEHEARKAREKEQKTGKDALCPVALDDSWKSCRWPGRLREQIMEYNILDFSG